MVIAYLMKYHKQDFSQAFEYVKALRPQINLNIGQRQAISDYFST